MVNMSIAPRQTIEKDTDVLNFGKHNGEEVGHVLVDDPQYLIWAVGKGIVEMPTWMLDTAYEALRPMDEDFYADWMGGPPY